MAANFRGMTDTSLAELDAALRSARPEFYAQLRPGVGESALDSFESNCGQALPSAFRELYRWRDGQPYTVTDRFVDNWEFMPLADVVETKGLLDSMIGTDFPEPEYWRAGWVPFAANGGGSYLCLDLRAEDGGTPGQVIEFWKADHDRPIAHPDLAGWIAHVVAGLKL